MGLSPNGYGKAYKIFTCACVDVRLALLLRRLRTEEATPTVQTESRTHALPSRNSLTTDFPGVSRPRPLAGAEETTAVGAARLMGFLGSTCTRLPAARLPLREARDFLRPRIRGCFVSETSETTASAPLSSTGGDRDPCDRSGAPEHDALPTMLAQCCAQTTHSGSSSKSAQRPRVDPDLHPAAPHLHCSPMASFPTPVPSLPSVPGLSMASTK